ncbi:serine/threonine protein kinase [Bacillus marasmi]|uniref:serine/threonine protein kinase n=1 Tax=Bacillus marasmi TaxID=1926279 RepID=UPI0011CB058A|nr:protein kinase family protein [Bacillus marasmi]
MWKAFVLTISNLIEKPFSNGIVIDERYKIIAHLGSGSYGHSYLVFDSIRQEKVVLKTLRWHKRLTQNGRNGFFKEILFLKEINSPFFPKLYDSGTVKSTPYFIMEFIQGKNFEQLIFEEGIVFDERESFVLGNELLEIIAFLQEISIVHRDIRIPNIMWDGKQIKVIDLGLAEKVNINQTEKKEKSRHPRKQIDYKSDYYGLGHFLLFLLYSGYTPPENGQEKSWEEELSLSPEAKMVIKKLLQSAPPYDTIEQIQLDLKKMIDS